MPRTRLIGRDVERAAGRQYVLDAAAPLLTLTGPGGVGKTRLALAIAADVRDAFADGVTFVDLAALDDPALVPAAVAAALEIVPAPHQTFAQALARALRARHILLLLDNCEHVLADAAALVDTLLVHCPHLQVLATSRAPLRLRAEQVFPVEPLPVPPVGAASAVLISNDAVALFADRARAVFPGFTLDASAAVMAGHLCRQLDGLPLAIELAAARSLAFPLSALLVQVQDRLQWPGVGPRDLPARQQTIRDTIAWSFDLLDADTQRLFCLLSVFVGGFTLETAHRTYGRQLQPGAVAAGIGQLVEQGLVSRVGPEGAARFQMLETIRAFGREQLAASGNTEAAGATHAEYFLAFAEALHPNRVSPAERVEQRVQRVETELANIRAALTWFTEHGAAQQLLRLAAALAVYWHLRAHFSEGRHWLERALAAAGPAPTAPRGHALAGFALILWAQSHYGQAAVVAQESLDIAEQVGDVEMAANALHVLGMIAEIQDRWLEATAYLTAACARWRRLDARVEEAWALTLLCRAAAGLGQPGLAVQHAEQALGLFRQVGHPIGIATALSRLAELARGRGDDEQAANAYREALRVYEEAGDPWLITLPLAGLADLAAAHGQAATAATLTGFLRALAVAAGAPLLSAARRCLERAERGATAHLGAARVQELQAAGGALTREEAVAAAAGVVVATRYGHRDDGAHSLTAREREILRLVAGMHTDQEIAAALSLSRRTVSGHVTHILAKLNVTTRRAAVARGRALGLLPDAGR
ncbi:MAG: hypothetical protein KC442_04620 [Thermomicrobiales bacterium]|nr:hypothetical protein [Thermomicrobiales bacterium]